MKPISLLAACFAIIAAVAGVAVASPSDEAETLIRKGVEQRRRGNHAQALELFERASAVTPSARALAQRGLAEISLRRWVDAERHLSEALERNDSPWIAAKENRTVLEKALAGARAHVGGLQVVGTDGAELKVNGHAVGRLPLSKPLRVEEGTARVTAVAPGKKPAEREVFVRGGAETLVRLDLEPEVVVPPPAASVAPIHPAATAVAPAPAQPPSPAAPEPPAATAPSSPVLVSSPPAQEGGNIRRQLAWGTAIVATAAFAGSLVETILWQTKRSDFNDPNNNCDVDDPIRGGTSCNALHESAESARQWAMIGYAATAVLGVTSALLFLSSAPAADTRSARVSCAPDFASPGMSCRLTF